MPAVIQHATAPFYWAAPGVWTSDPREALVFLDTVRALDYAFYHDIDQGTAVSTAQPRRSRQEGFRRMGKHAENQHL